MKYQFKLRVLFIAISGVGGVHAQEGGIAGKEQQSFALEEIVVTAQRKEESLQDAAIAIDAVAGRALLKSGITDAYELSKSVPALTIDNGGGSNTGIYIRGVGNRTVNGYIDPAIAQSYDGVYMGRGSAASGSVFFDLERVEVLKGPQGTLYGRNATGGAINILPARPELGSTSGYFTTSIGNYDSVQVQGAVSLPIGGSHALRLAANSLQRDGYNKDGTSDADTESVRIQLLSSVADNLTLRIGADYTKVGGIGPGASYDGSYVPDGNGGYSFIPSGLDIDEGMDTAAANAYRQTILTAPSFAFLVPVQDDWFMDNKYMGVNAEITYEIDAGTWTVIPAWRKVDVENAWSGPPAFNGAWIREDNEQLSLEVRFASDNSGPLNYLLGGYYFSEDIGGGPNAFNQESLLPIASFTQESASYAVFGQLTWAFADDLRLVAGARYTDDHKEFDSEFYNFITFCGGLPPTTPPASFALGCQIPGNLPIYPTLNDPVEALDWLKEGGWIDPATTLTYAPAQFVPLLNGLGLVEITSDPNRGDLDESEVTWRVSLEWDVAADSLLYATYETGYRSGGLQVGSALPTYAPEYVDAFTLGSKNRFFEGRLQLNAEAFYWKYEDQQISFFTNVSGSLVLATDNVGESTIQGLDLDFRWAATANTLVNAKVQYLDATYDDLHFLTASPRDNFGCPSTPTGDFAGGAPVEDLDCSGMQAANSPEWSLNVGIEQTFPMGDFNLIASANTLWRDDQWGGFEYVEHQLIESYWSTDIDLTLEPADGKWTLSAYARNLEDERHKTGPQVSNEGLGLSVYSAPLTYGLLARYNF